MAKSKTLNILNKGAITGLVVTALSFALPLVPCKQEAGFKLCQLPNPFKNLAESATNYYGISNNPLTGAIMQFIIPAVIIAGIFFLIGKKSKFKSTYKDLTEK